MRRDAFNSRLDFSVYNIYSIFRENLKLEKGVKLNVNI